MATANPLSVLQDVLARVVAIRESLEYGDRDEAAALAADLELDLVASVERMQRAG